MTHSSLKKKRGVRARKEGNYASPDNLSSGEYINRDLGLTLFPGFQVQGDDQGQLPLISALRPNREGKAIVGKPSIKCSLAAQASNWIDSDHDHHSISASASHSTNLDDERQATEKTPRRASALLSVCLDREQSESIRGAPNVVRNAGHPLRRDGMAEDNLPPESLPQCHGEDPHSNCIGQMVKESKLGISLASNSTKGRRYSVISHRNASRAEYFSRLKLSSFIGTSETAGSPSYSFAKNSTNPSSIESSPQDLHLFKCTANFSGSWTPHIPKKRRLKVQTKHAQEPSAISTRRYSISRPFINSDVQAVHPNSSPVKRNVHSALLSTLPLELSVFIQKNNHMRICEQRSADSGSSARRVRSLPILSSSHRMVRLEEKSKVDSVVQQVWRSASSEAKTLPNSNTRSLSDFAAHIRYGEDRDLLNTDDDFIISKKTSKACCPIQTIERHEQESNKSDHWPTYISSGESPSDTQWFGRQTLVCENKALRIELDRLSAIHKNRKQSFSRVLLEYGESYQKQRYRVRRLEHELANIRKALSASEAAVQESEKINDVLRKRLDKYGVFPRSNEIIARDILLNKRSAAAPRLNHPFRSSTLSQSVTEENSSLVALVDHSQQQQWIDSSDTMNGIFSDNLNFYGNPGKEYLTGRQQSLGASTAEYDPFGTSQFHPHNQRFLATDSAVPPQSLEINSANYLQEIGTTFPFSDADVAESTPPRGTTVPSLLLAAGPPINDAMQAVDTTNQNLTARTIIDLTKDGCAPNQSIDLTSRSPSLPKAQVDSVDIRFNLKTKDLAWLDGGHPLKGQAYNARRSKGQAAAKRQCLPYAVPDSAAPDRWRKTTKESNRDLQAADDQVSSPLCAQQRMNRITGDVQQPKKCDETILMREINADDSVSHSGLNSMTYGIADNQNLDEVSSKAGNNIHEASETSPDHDGRDLVHRPVSFDVITASQPLACPLETRCFPGPQVIDSVFASSVQRQRQRRSAGDLSSSSSNGDICYRHSDSHIASDNGKDRNTAILRRDSYLSGDDTNSLFDESRSEGMCGTEHEMLGQESKELNDKMEMFEVDEDVITEMHNKLVACQEEAAAQITDAPQRNQESKVREESGESEEE